MKNNSTSKTGLFLMELMMAILFFCLAAAVCVQMFIKGHILSDRSVSLNHAVVYCESMAETFYSCDGNLQEMKDFLEGTTTIEDHIINWNPDDSFKITGTLSEDNGLLNLNISCIQNSSDEEIYSLSVAYYPTEGER